MTTYVFKATVQEEEDGRWSALVDDLPGCTTWACSQEGALDALQDATELYMECMLEHGDPIPDLTIPVEADVTVTVSIDPVVE